MYDWLWLVSALATGVAAGILTAEIMRWTASYWAKPPRRMDTTRLP